MHHVIVHERRPALEVELGQRQQEVRDVGDRYAQPDEADRRDAALSDACQEDHQPTLAKYGVIFRAEVDVHLRDKQDEPEREELHGEENTEPQHHETGNPAVQLYGKVERVDASL